MTMFIAFMFLCSCLQVTYNDGFMTYMSNFKTISPPITIDYESRTTYFNHTSIWDAPRAIPMDMVKNYITDQAPYLTYEYGYGYGITWSVGEFRVAILHRMHDHGDNAYDFDLLEELLIVYNNNGKYIDSKTISKDNEVWQSITNVLDKNNIIVEQIRLTEVCLMYYGEQYNASITQIEYGIDAEGNITQKLLSKIDDTMVLSDAKKGLIKLD